MKNYRNERHGFEINVPEEWSFPTGDVIGTPFGKSLIFGCGRNEAFNLQIGLLIPEPSLDDTEYSFARHAGNRGYTELNFGRITVEGKDHLWAKYQMGFGDWTKKYMIVFGETEYAVTATCFAPKAFAEREKVWDSIVASFRLLPTVHARPVGEVEGAMQGMQFFELGYSHFRSGNYEAALEQFERGKTASRNYPWNYCGVSMTAMQMIEKGVISPDQFPVFAERAEKNIDECLRIAPAEPDYRETKKRISEFRKSLITKH
jgi:hypothetical protein